MVSILEHHMEKKRKMQLFMAGKKGNLVHVAI